MHTVLRRYIIKRNFTGSEAVVFRTNNKCFVQETVYTRLYLILNHSVPFTHTNAYAREYIACIRTQTNDTDTTDWRLSDQDSNQQYLENRRSSHTNFNVEGTCSKDYK